VPSWLRWSFIDSLVKTDQSGDGLPIRFVSIGSEDATVELSQVLMRHGYYTSPLFFPIIGRGKAGLRVMLRANMKKAEIEEFCTVLNSYSPTSSAGLLPSKS
jgi:7-keto-8-aminopelargonate synthetase-like enzyme